MGIILLVLICAFSQLVAYKIESLHIAISVFLGDQIVYMGYGLKICISDVAYSHTDHGIKQSHVTYACCLSHNALIEVQVITQCVDGTSACYTTH